MPPFPTAKHATNCRPSHRSNATCCSRGRWTGCSAATSVSARPKWRCGPPSKRSIAATRWRCSCRPPFWPSNTCHVSRPHGRLSFHHRRPVAVQHAGPAKTVLSALHSAGRHRHRHASAGPARRAVRQLGPADYRRGTTVRGRSERTTQSPAPHDRRADDDGHAYSPHAPSVAVGRARHFESRNPAR